MKPLKFICLIAACIGLTAPLIARAGTLASGFNTSVWNDPGTLPWGSHTDHGSEYYQPWDAEFGNGYLTLHSIYNVNGHRYESGTAWGKVLVPSGGYSWLSIDVDIYNPNAGVRGCWPAWWLDSAWNWPPEIDIAEFKGSNGGNVWQNAVGSDGVWSVVQTNINKSQWHHYGLALGPASGGRRTYQLFLDGNIRNQGSIPDVQGVPFWVIANYAMEGDSYSPGPNYNTYVQYHNYVLATH